MAVTVIAGCSASGTAPAARTGCRIPTPNRPRCAPRAGRAVRRRAWRARPRAARASAGRRAAPVRRAPRCPALPGSGHPAGAFGAFAAGVRNGGHPDDGVLGSGRAAPGRHPPSLLGRPMPRRRGLAMLALPGRGVRVMGPVGAPEPSSARLSGDCRRRGPADWASSRSWAFEPGLIAAARPGPRWCAGPGPPPGTSGRAVLAGAPWTGCADGAPPRGSATAGRTSGAGPSTLPRSRCAASPAARGAGAARRGDEAAVGRAPVSGIRRSGAGCAGPRAGAGPGVAGPGVAAPARPVRPAVKTPAGSGVPGSGSTRERRFRTSARDPTGSRVVRADP